MKNEKNKIFLELIKRPKNKNNLYSDSSIVISVFRSINNLAKQFLLKVLTKNSVDSSFFDFILKDLSLKDTKNDLITFEIIQARSNNDYLLNQTFTNTFKNIICNGYLSPFKEITIVSNKNEIEMQKKYAKFRWEKINEMIVGLKVSNFDPTGIITSLLEFSKLKYRINTTRITKEGFSFILSTTSQQINYFLYNYVDYLVSKDEKFEEIIFFILSLNLCHPNQVYSEETFKTIALNKLQKRILNDFINFGLIYKNTENTKYFQITPLLFNFSYEKSEINVDFKADIIVETNFRIYVYSISDFIVKLIEHFSVIIYRLPNLIIGELTRESVINAFQNNITADQLIDFLNKNIDPKKFKKIENLQKKSMNFHQIIEEKKIIEFLSIYQKEKDKKIEIPDNVNQQIKLWEKEKNVEYTREVIDDIKDNLENLNI